MRAFKNGRWVNTPEGKGIIFEVNAAIAILDPDTEEPTGDSIPAIVVHLTKANGDFKKEVIFPLEQVRVFDTPPPPRLAPVTIEAEK